MKQLYLQCWICWLNFQWSHSLLVLKVQYLLYTKKLETLFFAMVLHCHGKSSKQCGYSVGLSLGSNCPLPCGLTLSLPHFWLCGQASRPLRTEMWSCRSRLYVSTEWKLVNFAEMGSWFFLLFHFIVSLSNQNSRYFSAPSALLNVEEVQMVHLNQKILA